MNACFYGSPGIAEVLSPAGEQVEELVEAAESCITEAERLSQQLLAQQNK